MSTYSGLLKVESPSPGTYLVYAEGQQPVSGVAIYYYESVGAWRCEAHGSVTDNACLHRRIAERWEEQDALL